MRKPLAVVLGVTAAVLIAGGVVATTAGADTAPDEPAVPVLDLPGVPELPQLPGQDDNPAPPDLAAPARPANNVAADDANGTSANPGSSGDQRDRPAQDQHAGGQGDQGGPHAAKPGDQALPDRPAQDQTPQRPGGTRPAGQNGPAAKPQSLLAASQQDVSRSSVSTNPAAPVQQEVLALVNQNRRRGGCGDLSLDRRLISAAYDHATDMARRGYFAHESPNGDGSGDRMREAGYRWSRYGENIARGQESVYEVVDGWMHSPVHRENIMDCRLDQMGIGLAFAPDDTPYWVQDFATPQ